MKVKSLIFIRDMFRRYPLLLASNTLLIVFASVIEACSLFTIGPLIDFLIHPHLQGISPLTQRVIKAMDFLGVSLTLKGYIFVFIIFVILSSVLRIFVRYSIAKIRSFILRDIMIGTFEAFYNARWYFFSSSKQGTLLNTFVRESDSIGNAFGAMGYFFTSFIQLTFYLIIPFYISWQVTTISLTTAFLLSVPFMLLSKMNYQLGKLNIATGNEMGSVIQENFTLAKVVLGFGNWRKSIANFKRVFDVHCRISVLSQTLIAAIPILYRPLGAVVLVVSLFSAQRFGIPVSEIAVLLLALLQSVVSIGNLATQKNALDNFSPSYEQIKDLRTQARQLKQKTGHKQFEGFSKGIKIEEVSFAYPGHDLMLMNINMLIPKGKIIGIAGESGAGKSTLIDMIMGFNEPLRGRILFDGVNLWEFDINSYRGHIGYVPQDSVLFNMSIKDNLLWAKEAATDEEIKYACRQANADEFIEEFPNKYDTVVGDRGICLSGGQVQRIALARAIIRKPAVLILDEATSSLDTHSERLIQQAIQNISKETTIIVIAHRLSTIINSDYVYVLSKGRIIEEGRYTDLVRLDGHFNRMVKLQLLGIVNEHK